MNLQKFTEKAQEAVLTARQFAEDNSHSQVEPLHLLLALVQQREGVVPGVLTKLGVQPQGLSGRVEEELARLEQELRQSQAELNRRKRSATRNRVAESGSSRPWWRKPLPVIGLLLGVLIAWFVSLAVALSMLAP